MCMRWWWLNYCENTQKVVRKKSDYILILTRNKCPIELIVTYSSLLSSFFFLRMSLMKNIIKDDKGRM